MIESCIFREDPQGGQIHVPQPWSAMQDNQRNGAGFEVAHNLIPGFARFAGARSVEWDLALYNWKFRRGLFR